MRSAACAAAFFLWASALGAQRYAVDLDAAKTSIHWTLEGNVHTVHGTFQLKRGHLDVNPSTGTVSGEIVADAHSGQSANGARDKRMHKEILESDRFPDISFMPTKLEGAVNASRRSTVRLIGIFTIHGTSHQVTVPLGVTLSGAGVTATGQFSVPYVDWGLKDPSNFLFKVDKAVEVEIVASGTFTPE